MYLRMYTREQFLSVGLRLIVEFLRVPSWRTSVVSHYRFLNPTRTYL